MGSAFALGFMCVSSLNAGPMDTLISLIVSKATNPAKLCASPSFFEGTYTVRSLEGRLCSNVMIAAFAEKICPGAAADYNASKCHANATTALKGKTPDAALDEIIANGSAPGASKADKAKVLTANTIKNLRAKTIKNIVPSQESGHTKGGLEDQPPRNGPGGK